MSVKQVNGSQSGHVYHIQNLLMIFTWIIILQLLGNYQGYQSTIWEYAYEVLWSYEC